MCKAQQLEERQKFDIELGELKECLSKAEIEKQQHLHSISDHQSTIDIQHKKAKYITLFSPASKMYTFLLLIFFLLKFVANDFV